MEEILGVLCSECLREKRYGVRMNLVVKNGKGQKVYRCPNDHFKVCAPIKGRAPRPEEAEEARD